MKGSDSKKWHGMVMVLSLALSMGLLISACGSSETGGPPAIVSVQTGTATLHITNNSAHNIDIFLADPHARAIDQLFYPTAWPYLLYMGTPLAPSATRDMYMPNISVSNDATFCAGSNGFYACAWNVHVAPGATVNLTAQEADFGGQVRLVNGTGATITDMYYRQHGTTDWVHYATIQLPTGSQRTAPFPAGTWDYRLVYSGTNHDYTSGTVITGFNLTTLNVP